VAIIDQKERYRRQAVLCYELAKTMDGERGESMVRLGDAYSELAETPGTFRERIFSPAEKYAEPRCKQCRKKMRLTHSLPRTDVLPLMQAFRCDACGETLIWKGEIPAPTNERSGRNTAGDWEVRCVALSFKRTGNRRLAPGQSVECLDEQTAILRAELMMRDTSVVGAVAFSRRASADFRHVERAVILNTFGTVPKDFDIG
jgi:hypothetical protein